MPKSFGIMLYNDTNISRKYLIYQRRDSNAFIKLIRKLGNDNPIQLAKDLTKDEKDRLNNYDFKKIWDDLFINHSCRSYNVEERRARANYNHLKNSGILDKIINEPESIDLAWSFPKGRIDRRDDNEIECALREFREETNMPTDDFDFSLHLDVYEYKVDEDYSFKFYPATTQILHEIKYRKVNDRIRDTYITDESNDLKWIEINEAEKYLKEPYLGFLKNLDSKLK